MMIQSRKYRIMKCLKLLTLDINIWYDYILSVEALKLYYQVNTDSVAGKCLRKNYAHQCMSGLKLFP